MYPNQEPQQINPTQPPNNMQEFNPNFTGQNPSFTPTPTPASSKSGIPKKYIIIGVIVGVAILAMIIIVIVSMGSGTDKNAQIDVPVVEQSLVPEPATAEGLQQTNTSIGQDLSSLDNTKDFSTTKLDDKALGL